MTVICATQIGLNSLKERGKKLIEKLCIQKIDIQRRYQINLVSEYQHYVSVGMQSLLREAQVFLEQISFVKKSTVSNLKRLEMFLGIFSFSVFSFFFVYLIFKESQQLRLQCGTSGLDPWVGKIPWRRAWQPTPVFLPGESSWTEKPSGLQSMGSQRVRHD